MFVRNPSGTVHSVPDDFKLPDDTWQEVTEADAPASLLGSTDPAVAAVELHNLSDAVVVDESGPAVEPGVVDSRESNDIQPPTGPTPENPPADVALETTPEVTA
jgi:hypothetical protein